MNAQRFLIIFVAACMIALLVVAPALAEGTDGAWVSKIPYQSLFYNACNGEYVQISGQQVDIFKEFFDTNGGYHLLFNYSENGSSGYGLTSGIKYHLVGGAMRTILDINELPYVDTYAGRVRLVGEDGSIRTLQSIRHVTINANGEITVDLSFNMIDCK